jgi:ABC-type proline/glycine betaine transport system permease subunit
MRRYAVTAAVVVFFAMALVGAACGAEPLDCGLRGLAGAAAAYVLVGFGGRVVLSILADAVLRGPSRVSNVKDATREQGH